MFSFKFTNVASPIAGTLQRIPSDNMFRVPGFSSRSAVFIGEK